MFHRPVSSCFPNQSIHFLWIWAGLKIGTPRQVFLRSPDGILVATKEILGNKIRKHKWTPFSFEHSKKKKQMIPTETSIKFFLFIFSYLFWSIWLPKCYFTKAHPFVNVPKRLHWIIHVTSKKAALKWHQCGSMTCSNQRCYIESPDCAQAITAIVGLRTTGRLKVERWLTIPAVADAF